MVRADRGDVELGEGARRRFRGQAAKRLRVLVEGEEADDRQRRDAAYGRDRGEQLVEVVERLDREEIDAAALEEARLLGEDRLAILGGTTEGADRAGDEHVRAGDLAGIACDLDGRLVDRRDLVLEVVLGELAPVRAERVRLDDVGSGADESQMEREDALGRAHVRLLRTPEACHGARDEHSHATVADERRPAREPLEEATHRAIPAVRPVKFAGQHSPGDRSSTLG